MSETSRTAGGLSVNEQDKKVIEALLSTVREVRKYNERMTVVSYNGLSEILSPEQMRIIDRVYAINPARYGFRGPRLGIEPVPDTLVRVEPQSYSYKGEQCYTNVQFIPEAPYRAFRRMADALARQLGRILLIESSYRSDAFQAVTFLSILRLNNYDVAATARRAAIPGYSEHGTPSQLALDVQNIDGLPSDETPQDFADTREYHWLVNNAHTYDFYLSYPKDNPYGLMFEPWHWRHKPQANV